MGNNGHWDNNIIGEKVTTRLRDDFTPAGLGGFRDLAARRESGLQVVVCSSAGRGLFFVDQNPNGGAKKTDGSKDTAGIYHYTGIYHYSELVRPTPQP